jgi:hypothetical protein
VVALMLAVHFRGSTVAEGRVRRDAAKFALPHRTRASTAPPCGAARPVSRPYLALYGAYTALLQGVARCGARRLNWRGTTQGRGASRRAPSRARASTRSLPRAARRARGPRPERDRGAAREAPRPAAGSPSMRPGTGHRRQASDRPFAPLIAQRCTPHRRSRSPDRDADPYRLAETRSELSFRLLALEDFSPAWRQLYRESILDKQRTCVLADRHGISKRAVQKRLRRWRRRSIRGGDRGRPGSLANPVRAAHGAGEARGRFRRRASCRAPAKARRAGREAQGRPARPAEGSSRCGRCPEARARGHAFARASARLTSLSHRSSPCRWVTSTLPPADRRSRVPNDGCTARDILRHDGARSHLGVRADPDAA